MKKLSKLLALAAGFATLFLAACSNISDGAVSEGVNDRTSNKKTYNVSFASKDGTVWDFDQLGITSNTVSRTIVADTVDLATEKVYFYLWGSNETDGSDVDPEAVTFVANEKADNATRVTKGTVTLDKVAAKYYFALACTTTEITGTSPEIDDIKEAAIYIGYANVDLREGDEIKFYISADGLPGTGGYNLTLKADKSWTASHIAAIKDLDASKISAFLTDRATNTLVSGTSSGELTKADFFGTGVSVNAADLPAGDYNFVVQFLYNGKTYEWSDLIIILPNRTVAKPIEVPDRVEYEPETPSGFHVAYIAPTVSTDEMYNAVLGWTDNSDSEKYFLIEAIDVSGLAKAKFPLTGAKAFADWQEVEQEPSTLEEDSDEKEVYDAAVAVWDGIGTSAAVVRYGRDFYGNYEQNWVAGSLQRGNTSIVLKLALGKRYIFRIAAVNDATKGTAKNPTPTYWAYATFGTDVTHSDSDDPFNGSATYEGKKFVTTKEIPEVKSINAKTASSIFEDTPTVTYYESDDAFEDDDTGYKQVKSDATALTAAALKALWWDDSAKADKDSIPNVYYLGKKYSEKQNKLDEDGKAIPATAPATGYVQEDVIAPTANLYRLIYHLNGGTLAKSSTDKSSKDIVEYHSEGEVPLLCITNKVGGDDYDQLYDANNKPWTAWKLSSISGTNYGTQSKKKNADGSYYVYYYPGFYTTTVETDTDRKGFANLDLYAIYSSSNGSVIAYNDAEYDITDTVEGSKVKYNDVKGKESQVGAIYWDAACTIELTDDQKTELASDTSTEVYIKVVETTAEDARADIAANGTRANKYFTDILLTPANEKSADDLKAKSGISEEYTIDSDTKLYYAGVKVTPIISITTTTGVTQTSTRTYKVKATTASVTLKYTGTVAYASMRAEVKRTVNGNSVAAGNFNSKQFTIDTQSLPLGTYSVMIYGVYGTHTYSYPITINITD